MWNSTGETLCVCAYMYTSIYAHMYSYIHLCIGLYAIHKPSSVINAKKQRKTIEWERLEISSRKSEIPSDIFMQRWVQ